MSGRAASSWSVAPSRRAASLAALIALTLTAVVAPPVAAGPPSHDAFASAIKAKPLPYTHTVDTTGATTEVGEPANSFCADSESSVWYWFRSSTPINVRASTAGSSYDTTINIWRGTSLATLQEVTCNVDIQNGDGPYIGQSRVTWRAAAGVRYYIQVNGEGATPTGTLEFKLEQVTRPANDNFGASQVINALPLTTTVSNTKATIENGERVASAECENSMATLWYRLTVPTDRVVRADTLGALNDTLLAVYTGTAFNNLVQRVCNDDTAAGGTRTFASSVAWKANGGTDYYIQLGGYEGENVPGIPFNVRTVTPPANDDWQNATNIPSASLPHLKTGNTRNSTRQSGEPINGLGSCDGNRFHTVWYKHTHSTTDDLTVEVSGSGWTPDVVIYTGNALNNLTPVDCGGSFTFTATAGVTYYFQVSESFGESGAYDFSLEVAP